MGIGSAVAGAAKDAIDARAELERRLKGRTPEQQSVVKYFLKGEGCLSKNITDAEYETLIRNRVNSLNSKQKALDKIGLDESQVNEIPPVYFEGYVFESEKKNEELLAKVGKDREWRSARYQVSWLFFSDTQVYLYQYTFNMDEDGKKEATNEYFYKDITSFSTSSDTVEALVTVEKGGCLSKTIELFSKAVDTERFALAVPGDKFYCSLTKKQDTEGVIQAMKAKLREKKQ
jgi:hypothetical protein